MNNETSKLGPFSLESEENVISSCLLDGDQVVTRCLEGGIYPSSFYDPKHQKFFAHIEDMHQRGVPIETSTLAEEMKKAGTLEGAGGIPYLTQVSAGNSGTASTDYHIKNVVEHDQRRRIVRALNIAREEACDTSNDASTLGERVVALIIDAVGTGTSTSRTLTWKDSVAKAEAWVLRTTDANATAADDPETVAFGIPDLDRYLGSPRRGQLIVLGGRPSTGKSSLARQIAYHVFKNQGRQVLFASLEVMGPDLARNIAQTVTGLSAKALSPQTHPRDSEQFQQVLRSLADPKFDVLAASKVTLAKIRIQMRFLRQRGSPVDVLIVDYLGLLPDGFPSKGETRAASLGRVSRELKQLALEENCVVLVLCQLNRDSERSGREPALHDLRDSGDIEQDADKVILLYRPEQNPDTKESQSQDSSAEDVPRFHVRIIQAKGRDDGTASVGLSFVRRITRFEQMTKRHQA